MVFFFFQKAFLHPCYNFAHRLISRLQVLSVLKLLLAMQGAICLHNEWGLGVPLFVYEFLGQRSPTAVVLFFFVNHQISILLHLRSPVSLDQI